LTVGARTVGRAHPDRWALEVLAEILGEDLVQEIRYRRGLVYGLWAYNTFFDDTGYFVIATMSERDKREAILSTVEGWKTGSLEDWKLGYNLALFPIFRPSSLPTFHPSTLPQPPPLRHPLIHRITRDDFVQHSLGIAPLAQHPPQALHVLARAGAAP
jgi:hypothetical protein